MIVALFLVTGDLVQSVAAGLAFYTFAFAAIWWRA